MKFSIVKSDFLRPLSHIYSVVEKRNTIPILSNVVIESLENKIALQLLTWKLILWKKLMLML